MQILRRLEDILVQIIRLVLLIFAAMVLIALAVMLAGKLAPESSPTPSADTVAWADVQPDLQFMVEETGRDLGLQPPDQQLAARLSDAQLRPAFQKVDQLLRSFMAQQPAQHARIEKDNQARGLAPVHPLLQGEGLPTAQAVATYVTAQQERALAVAEAQALDETAADAAAAASDDEEQACCWSDAVDIAQLLHDSATQQQAEHGPAAYTAFVRGAPAAFEQVLGNAALATKLHSLTAAQLVETIMTNYNISFSRAVSAQDSNSSDSDSLLDSVFNSIELTMWSVVLSFLVLVVFMVTVVRMEKHLRTLSLQGSRRD